MSKRFLFLGLGGVGQRHLRNLLKLEPQAEIAAVRRLNRSFAISPDLQANAKIDIVAEYKIRLFPSLEAAIRDFKPNAAIIASPTSAHFEQLLPLIKAKIPVLLEKPMVASLEELESLEAALRASPSLVMPAYMLPFNPSVQKLLQLVKEQRIGRLFSGVFEANSYLPSWHPYEKPNEFYAGRADLGGGVVLTESHIVNLLYLLLGKPVSLWARGGKLSGLEIDVEDNVTTLLSYDNPLVPPGVCLLQSFVQRPPGCKISLRGEKGRIDWSLLENQVILEDAESGLQEVFKLANFDRNQMFVAEMEYFLGSLDKPEASRQSLEGERILHLIKKSLNSGRPEDL